MIRVSAISYLNSVPFVYGLTQEKLREYINLDLATPAATAYRLQNNLCDLAIVPVAAIPSLPWSQIIGNHCIGAVSAVASVLLCSHVPVNHITEIALDNESLTSVQLVKLLLQSYWHVSPRFVPLPANFPNQLPQSVVLIGDKALLHRKEYPYIYDLAEHWICWTGKPFVFAAWMANKALPDSFITIFDAALAYGVAHMDQAITSQVPPLFPSAFAKEYLTHNISFTLDQEKREGLELFWKLTQEK